MPALPETAWFELVPDWAWPVLSPSTARAARMLKMPFYATTAVAYCWLLDPTARTLEAFKLREGQWLLLAGFVDEADVAVAPFDALAFPLAGGKPRLQIHDPRRRRQGQVSAYRLICVLIAHLRQQGPAEGGALGLRDGPSPAGAAPVSMHAVPPPPTDSP